VLRIRNLRVALKEGSFVSAWCFVLRKDCVLLGRIAS
jgi:hypothetical protein